MPELEAKIRMAPSTNNSTTKGISHHFFSCRANSRNSLNNRHMRPSECTVWSPDQSRAKRCECACANCAKSIVTREGVERGLKGYVAPKVGLPWPEWIKQ